MTRSRLPARRTIPCVPRTSPGRRIARAAGTCTLLAVGLAAPTLAQAQPYDLSWHTIDGGGGVSSGGPYTLSATAGQPDAGGPFAGGTYVVRSGFWAVIADGVVAPQADLSITKTNGQSATVPGETVTYTIVVGNAGPTAVTGATVSDTLPASLLAPTWSCAPSAGGVCPPSGALPGNVTLPVGGSVTFTLTATVAPDATGTLTNTASVAAPAGVLDPSALNNAAADMDVLTPEADLALATTDSPDPAAQGAILTYTLDATNDGPSVSPSMTLVDTLPAQVAFIGSTPGAPTCTHAAGVVTCALGPLVPGATATVTLQVTVSPPAVGPLSNQATLAGGATDPAGANNSDSESTAVIGRSDGELGHGTRERFDLAALPGPLADEDRYRISQRPFSSYEVIVDEASGDLGTGNGPSLERLDAAGAALQSSLPVGSGPSRSLAWENDTSATVEDQTIRVRSTVCGTDCGPDDRYRIRAYETTLAIPRFNNSGSQLTVLLLQNPGASDVAGHVHFWSPAGALLATHPFSLAPKQLLVLVPSAVPAIAGQSGTITVTHDGPYGVLAGKTVALEPATGFSFDSPMEVKRR
jgi:uncharacterized repeat protein (TIGR01451 family)